MAAGSPPRAARANPAVYALDTDGTGGGSYSDNDVTDEFYWAASELFITTGKSEYQSYMSSSPFYKTVPSAYTTAGDPAMTWGSTAALGTLSLAVVPNSLPASEQSGVRAAVTGAADVFVNTVNSQGYGTPLSPPATTVSGSSTYSLSSGFSGISAS